MDVTQIQEYKSYREYIEERLKHEPFGRGGKAQLAKHLNCQPSFISQILKERAVLSLEQAHDINSFFDHNKLEKDYFMNLVEFNNSGTTRLKDYFEVKLNEIREKFKLIENRFEYEELEDREILTYYNNKYHTMIHHLVNIPKYKTRESLKEKLDCSIEEINDAVSFLIKSNLIFEDEDFKLQIKRSHLHIKKNSPLAHYVNVQMRLQNIKEIKTATKGALNYGAHFTCSKALYDELRVALVEKISEFSNKLPTDNPEQLCSIVLDLKEL